MSLPKYLPHTNVVKMLVGERFSQSEHDALEQELVNAIHAETLDVVDVQVRDDSGQLPAIEGWRSLGNEIGKLNGVRTWINNHGAVRYILKPEPFAKWLHRMGRWSLPDGCELAAWCGAEAQAAPVTKAESRRPRMWGINKWLYEKWEKHERPGAADFFQLLAKYKRAEGSPITDWYEVPKKAITHTLRGKKELTATAIGKSISKWKKWPKPGAAETLSSTKSS